MRRQCVYLTLAGEALDVRFSKMDSGAIEAALRQCKILCTQTKQPAITGLKEQIKARMTAATAQFTGNLRERLLDVSQAGAEKSNLTSYPAPAHKEQSAIAAQVIASAAPEDIARLAGIQAQAGDLYGALLVAAAQTELAMRDASSLGDTRLIDYLALPSVSLSTEAKALAEDEAGKRAMKKFQAAIMVLKASLCSENHEEFFTGLMAYCGNAARAQRLLLASGKTTLPDADGMIRLMLQKIEAKDDVLARLSTLSLALGSHLHHLPASDLRHQAMDHMANEARLIASLLTPMLNEGVNRRNKRSTVVDYLGLMTRVVSGYLYNIAIPGIACDPPLEAQNQDVATDLMVLYKEDLGTDPLSGRLVTEEGSVLPVCKQFLIEQRRSVDIDVHGSALKDFTHSSGIESVQKFVQTLRNPGANDPQIMAASQIACAAATNVYVLLDSKKLFPGAETALTAYGVDLSQVQGGVLPSACKQKTRIWYRANGNLEVQVLIHVSPLHSYRLAGNTAYTDPAQSAFRAEVIFSIDKDEKGSISIHGPIMAGLKQTVISVQTT